jgi:LmbE family N-acetylglucosaminyl deacetylase
MESNLKLMAILAHPDDESLGLGGTLAKYAAEGVDVHLLTATRGERGWPRAEEENPGLSRLGQIREAELRAAAAALGIGQVDFLDYVDGDVDLADPDEAIARISRHLRLVRPQVVVTFGADGGYGHPDHIAVAQFAAAAIVCAADAGYAPDSGPPHSDAPHSGAPHSDAPHRVSKLYWRVWSQAEQDAYQSVFGDLIMHIDGRPRVAFGWDEWIITTRLDTAAYASRAWQAIQCHQSQLPEGSALERLSEERRNSLWASEGYYRVFSTANGGRRPESDLFEGLRPAKRTATQTDS